MDAFGLLIVFLFILVLLCGLSACPQLFRLNLSFFVESMQCISTAFPSQPLSVGVSPWCSERLNESINITLCLHLQIDFVQILNEQKETESECKFHQSMVSSTSWTETVFDEKEENSDDLVMVMTVSKRLHHSGAAININIYFYRTPS